MADGTNLEEEICKILYRGIRVDDHRDVMKESKYVERWESSKGDNSGNTSKHKDQRRNNNAPGTMLNDEGRTNDDQTHDFMGYKATENLEDRQ